MRLPVPIVAAMLLAGCNSPPSHYDPFMGRTTVPPPGTIQAPPPGAVQPYYQGAPAYQGAPGTVPVPGPAPTTVPAPPPGSPLPPGTYGMPQSSADRPQTLRPGPDEYLAGKSAIARRSPVIQTGSPPGTGAALTSANSPAGAGLTWQPTSNGTSLPGAPVEPGRFDAPKQVREITDLPAARTAAK